MSNSLQIAIVLLICMYGTSCISTDYGEFDQTEIVNLQESQAIYSLQSPNINNLTKLINASSNPLLSFDKDSFKIAVNLTVFLMNNNTDYKFPKDEAFLVHQNLQTVSFDSCEIRDVYNETFSMLPNLTSISMDHNLIETLNESIFQNNLNLKFLSVNSNKIKTISPNLLLYKWQFKELQMNSNRNFNFIGNQPFLSNKAITIYKCEYCNVTTIYQKTFSEMKNITQLLLNHNNISRIEMKSFDKNDAIEVLELNNNSLTDVPLEIFDKKNLRIFHIDLNEFVPSEENNILKKKYKTKSYRSPNSMINKGDYFENKLGDFSIPTTTVASSIQTPAAVDDNCTSQNTPEGISDAFISTYLTLIVVVQIVVLVLTISCWIKKSREESSEYIDYSKTVLNEHDIYKMN